MGAGADSVAFTVAFTVAVTVTFADTNTVSDTNANTVSETFSSSCSANRIVVLGRLKGPRFAPASPPLTRPALADVREPHKEVLMKTYKLALEMVREVAEINKRIDRQDRDLARQLRRASMSVPLNINEGMYSRGKNRGARLTDAMASAKESVACLEVAAAVGYVGASGTERCLARLDHLVAALWNMVHKPWR